MLKHPIRDHWIDFHNHCLNCYHKWFEFWIKEAERNNTLVYFFRFEDVIANPEKELTEIMKFILGIESVEGTVMEHRVKEVMGWDPSKHRGYKPRNEGKGTNYEHFEPEMIKRMADKNEDIFHIFGYAKDDREDNTTPFIDYEGKARPENVERTNYYKKLNERAWQRRLALPHGELPEEKLEQIENAPGSFQLISDMNVFAHSEVVRYLEYEGV